ncbi:Tad domain-containing protein [Novosphingobium sp.]|uniref:Tad domain-containing protein n=1 Tax=Novosphingobium sp. TaxID=1874826 RepID=UPI001DA04219|nr:Tad domain-containing protein [Novosphingobium sp.]MBX9664915.1 Tad domain-containing protein [Novosphingobium sp.]
MPRRSKATGGQIHASMRVLIASLLRDTAGTTMGIALATIILLVSLVGSGTDMARAYMTKTSLQNACDAGVLAGRKAMATSGTYGTSETAKANKMFNFNFNPLATNSQNVTFNTEFSGTGAVSGTASTQMPTVIMGIFGFKSITLTVACSAELQMASADVMFVLDTTGSMAWTPAGVNVNSGAGSKIVALRQAILDFYKTVASSVVDKTNTRIRFGFVPYTATVNMGGIIAAGQMPTSYFADTQPFQTALANFNTPVYVGTTGPATNSTETFGSTITNSQCNSYGANNYPSAGNNPVIVAGGPPPADTTYTTYSVNSWTRTSGNGNNARGTCVRNVSTATTTNYELRYQFTNWTFQAATVDVRAFKGMSDVSVVTNIASNATVPNQGTYDMPSLAALNGTPGVTGLTTTNTRWDGCIEERKTVQNLAMNPVPSGATDLDVDSAPTGDDTRWKIYENDLVWYRGTNTGPRTVTSLSGTGIGREGSQCPPSAMLFTEVDTSDPNVVPTWLDNYVQTLVAAGSTYHDIGMIWGARLASPNGIFQSNVNADPVKYPSVSRHIIFMTDGDMAPSIDSYSAYGEEIYDNRVAPSGTNNSTLRNYHNNRFLAACTKAKNLGYTVWLIGFGTSLTTQMTSCATAGRAYYASDTTALNNTFKFIAGQVADLRINK